MGVPVTRAGTVPRDEGEVERTLRNSWPLTSTAISRKQSRQRVVKRITTNTSVAKGKWTGRWEFPGEETPTLSGGIGTLTVKLDSFGKIPLIVKVSLD